MEKRLDWLDLTVILTLFMASSQELESKQALRRKPTVQVSLVQDLRLDDFFDYVLQGDDSQNLVERVSLTLIVDPLNYGHVGFS